MKRKKDVCRIQIGMKRNLVGFFGKGNENSNWPIKNPISSERRTINFPNQILE